MIFRRFLVASSHAPSNINGPVQIPASLTIFFIPPHHIHAVARKSGAGNCVCVGGFRQNERHTGAERVRHPRCATFPSNPRFHWQFQESGNTDLRVLPWSQSSRYVLNFGSGKLRPILHERLLFPHGRNGAEASFLRSA